MITETVFAIPGVGRLIVSAIRQLDFPVVQAGVFMLAMIVVSVNFLVDVLYLYLNPDPDPLMAVRPIPAGIAYADDADRRAARSRTWRKLGRNPAAVLGVLILLAWSGRHWRHRGSPRTIRPSRA